MEMPVFEKHQSASIVFGVRWTESKDVEKEKVLGEARLSKRWRSPVSEGCHRIGAVVKLGSNIGVKDIFAKTPRGDAGTVFSDIRILIVPSQRPKLSAPSPKAQSLRARGM